MEGLDRLVDWKDIVKGVGELVVDEAKLVLHAVFDQFRHETPSEHFHGAAHQLDNLMYGHDREAQ